MDLKQLGRTGTRVSELCLGCMTFGNEADEATSRAIVDRFLDAGGNFIDTADVYSTGVSEEITGRAIAGRRDEVVLATKVRFPMGRARTRSVRRAATSGRESRRRCGAGTDWIDLYQIHCWDPRTPLEETISTLDDLVREGKVRYVGASNYAGWHLAKALGIAALHGWEPFVSLQPEYSLITRDLERELLPLCREEGLAVLPWSPLAGGVLTGKYQREAPSSPKDTRWRHREPDHVHLPLDERAWNIVDAVRTVADATGHTPAQVALNWVAEPAGDHRADHRGRTVAQLDDNLGAIGWTLEKEHRDALAWAARSAWATRTSSSSTPTTDRPTATEARLAARGRATAVSGLECSDGEQVAGAGVGRRVAQLAHRPGLDLADALPGRG